MRRVACGEGMESYFQDLASRTDYCYGIARRARSRGKDPEVKIEIPQAEDLASRVEKQLEEWGVEGVAERIRELSEEHGNREVVSLLIAKEIATRPARTREEAIDRAVRVGLAVLTEGILVAPLEGIASVRIGRNSDDSEYLSILFAGPIRAAGGTGQAMSVLIGDVVRRELNIGEYRPTAQEVARFHEEIPLYKSLQHLQYTPGGDEIDLIVENCPVCIDGEGTEKEEISGYRDLPRVETNRVRGGACLVIAEGLTQKAAKIQKHVQSLGIDGWEFIEELLSPQEGDEDESEQKVKPGDKYLKDIVAGRPIFGHPSRPGGFRLRYGRGRTCGLAAIAISPASMYALDEFPAIGTQIKIERPGKAGAVTPCDSIEGPIVLLRNGDLLQCNSSAEVKALGREIAELVDIGEMLIPFGEFSENNHPLVPAGYCLEWHREELREALGEPPSGWESQTLEEALRASREHGVPLHPRHNLFWSDVALDDLIGLKEHILRHGRAEEGALLLKNEAAPKRTLESLGALHRMSSGEIRLEEWAAPLLLGLGLEAGEGGIVDAAPLQGDDSLQAVSAAMGVTVMPRAQTRIGGRMARPEKAKERRMNPPVHALFPIGMEGGAQRLMSAALEKSKDSSGGNGSKGTIMVDLGLRHCPGCGSKGYLITCPGCNGRTLIPEDSRTFERRPKTKVRLVEDYARALESLGLSNSAPEVKGVQGMTSREKVPEPLEKGILRAKHEVYVFKDGTCRFDMTDLPLTHFRPREIGLSVERAIELGYERDMHGEPLTDGEQLCELKVQDFVPSTSCGDYMVRVAAFIDELLVKFYGLEPFYNVEGREGLIGHLGIGLAPHTSGGVLLRIIGFMPASGGYAHPFFHAAKRRNCDGDEDSIILLLDGLMNFSRLFLPDRRGGLMDAPLVLTTRLDPDEVDKEAHNLDCLHSYPLELYHAAMEYRHPREIEGMMDMVSSRIGSNLQFEGIGFTHDTADIAEGPFHSKYTTLETMMDKMHGQLELGRKIRAVDEKDVITRVVDKHFLPDMVGNLRSFSAQNLRCTRCGEKYRRIPLAGKCRCGNSLTLTVHEASVKKYLQVSKEMGERYGLSEYTRQRIEVLEMSMASLFDNDKVRKCKLSDFM